MAYRAAVVGGSGYTGAELLRLLAGHPEIEVVLVTADSNAGAARRRPLPVAGRRVPRPRRTSRSSRADLAGLDVVFLRPAARPVAGGRGGARRHRRPRRRPRRRLPAAAARRTSSGTARRHQAPELIDRFAFGMPELYRDEIAGRASRGRARVLPDDRVARARAAARRRAGGADRHRRRRGVGRVGRGAGPEGDQPLRRGERERHRLRPAHAPPHRARWSMALAHVAGQPVQVLFTPHLVPMTRGILATCYARPAVDGARAPPACSRATATFYADEPFVRRDRRLAGDQGDPRARTPCTSPCATTSAPAPCSRSARSTTS